MSFIFMVLHYPTLEHRDELARQMGEMGAFLSATPGCVEVGPPYLTEDGRCLIGISTWESKEAFLAAGLTVGGSDEVVLPLPLKLVARNVESVRSTAEL